jgi:sugar phosphate isomerase/epimerase
VKFAICNETYGDWSFERVCADVAECGYDGIEIALSVLEEDPSNLSEHRAQILGEVARVAGLEVVGLHWLLKAPDGMHLTTPDARVRRRTADYLRHLARLCAAAGGQVMVLGSPKQRDVVAGDAYQDAFARAAETCRAVAETAAPLGVCLALEPLAPAYTNFLTTASEAVQLIEAVDHPACRLHLDVFAMSSEALPMEAIIARYGQYLVHFHANDIDMRGPGSTDLDYRPIALALEQAAYDRYVSVEVFDMKPDGPTIAKTSIDYLRRIWP